MWREEKKEKLAPGEDPSYTMEEVRLIKTECLNNPMEKLWRGATRQFEQVRQIFYHLNSLKYEDKPDYQLIRDNLRGILSQSLGLNRQLSTSTTVVPQLIPMISTGSNSTVGFCFPNPLPQVATSGVRPFFATFGNQFLPVSSRGGLIDEPQVPAMLNELGGGVFDLYTNPEGGLLGVGTNL